MKRWRMAKQGDWMDHFSFIPDKYFVPGWCYRFAYEDWPYRAFICISNAIWNSKEGLNHWEGDWEVIVEEAIYHPQLGLGYFKDLDQYQNKSIGMCKAFAIESIQWYHRKT